MLAPWALMGIEPEKEEEEEYSVGGGYGGDGGEINNLCGDNKTAISGRNERWKTGAENKDKK